MSDWRNFLAELSEKTSEAWKTLSNEPGEVMICFVNRYLEGLDGIKYKVRCDGKTTELVTTEEKYCVKVTPKSFEPIEIHVWSRMSKAYKQLKSVTPNVGSKKLVREVMKTYKTHGKTEQHARNVPVAPPPQKPAPAPPPAQSPTDRQGVKPIPKKDESGLPQTQVERPVPDKIMKEQLKKIFPAAKENYLQKIADELNKDLVKFKLDTPVRRAHFFGQTRQETGPGAKGDAESLNYSSQGLIDTFKYYGKHKDEARQDGRHDLPHKKGPALSLEKQRVIANKVYGTNPKAEKLGNLVGTDDGWNYRGRGLKQTTGRRNYKNFSAAHWEYWGEQIDFATNPDLAAEFPYSVRSAVVFWLKNDCWKAADKGVNDAAIDAVTMIVNSGEISNHKSGKHKSHADPVLNRRKYVYLAYAAFT